MPPRAEQRRGVTLTWSDLSVYLKTRQPRLLGRTRHSYKRIVNNISGAVQAGKMVAMLGPSGAGKSTVLLALARRFNSSLLVDGDVRVDGERVDKTHMRQLSGFVHQEDLFIGALTVLEHLNFMAELRMDRRTSSSSKKRWISELISVLGLTSCSNRRIGGVGLDREQTVLSGGERKRVMFAAECLTDPPLLFCDEPTTGLDSYSALALAGVMRSLSDSRHKTILATVHQPSPDLLAMFDSVVMLAEGTIAFIGTAQQAVDFFQQQGYTMSKECSVGEHLVGCLAPTPGSEQATERAVHRLAHQFALSDQAKELDMIINYHHNLLPDSVPGKSFDYKEPFWMVKLYWMCRRSSIEVIRNPNVQWIRIFQKVLIAVMAGLCYFGSVSLTQAGVQAVQGALFILVTENTFAPMYAVLNLFPVQFPLFLREYNNGICSPLHFYLTKVIAALPGLVVEASIFTTIFYYLAGLRESSYAYFMITLVTILCINVSAACGSMFSTAFESPSFAMAYLIPFDYVMMITSGLFVKLSSLPAVTSWVQYLSWLMYSYESMSIVQWNGVENITCAVDQPYLPCANSGLEVLENYSFSPDHLLTDLYAMLALYFAFHVIAFILLLRRIKQN